MHRDVELQAVAIVDYRVRDEATSHGIVDHLEHNAARVDIARDDLTYWFFAGSVIQIHQSVNRIWPRPFENL